MKYQCSLNVKIGYVNDLTIGVIKPSFSPDLHLYSYILVSHTVVYSLYLILVAQLRTAPPPPNEKLGHRKS